MYKVKPMNQHVALKLLILLASVSAIAEEKSRHPVIYHDSTSGNWVPPSQARDWTMTFSNEVGYRRDRQKFRSKANHSVAYLHQFNTVSETADLVFTWERLLIKLSADYGWLINGSLNFKALDHAFSEPSSFSMFKMGSGYSADVKAAIGCRIKFWKFNYGSLSFIPALGYIYSHFNAYPKEQHRSAGTSGYSTLEYSRPIQQDLFGPLVEGRIAFSWKEQWRFDCYYQYIPNNFRETAEQSIGNFTFNPPTTLTQANLVRSRIASKSDTTRTQLGGADISYRSPSHWQIGARVEGSSTWSNTGHSITHQKTTDLLPDTAQTKASHRDQLSIQWVRYLANVYASYWF